MSLRSMVCLALLAAPTAPAFGSDDRPPNVVVLFADDLGYADLGCFGGHPEATPNLDRMAREGIKFTDFYVAQAVCSASRTALLTGRYPNRVGILGALGPGAKNGIRDEETTLGEVFRSREYATAIFGKWHLGDAPEFLPTRHGFDEYHGLPYSNDMWPNHPTNKTFPPLPLIEGDRVVETNPDQRQLTRWATERSLRFIETNKERPFFLYVPYSMPHVPIFASERFEGKTGRGLHADVIAEIDDSVGQILEALRQHGLDESTLVIFTSDNGPWLTYGDHAGSALPLREGKGTNHDGGVRVPFVARWLGQIPAGSICSEPAMTIDLLPTFAGLIGAELPPTLDGLDIVSLLLAKQDARSPHEALYFYWNRQLQAVRSGRWKLQLPHEYQALAEPGSGGLPGRYERRSIGRVLYDLESDPGETNDLAAEHPEIVERLEALADSARRDLGDEPPPGR